jgi:hypothetical protein
LAWARPYFPIARFRGRPQRAKKMLMLGIDGMDIRLTEQFLRQGRLPNIQKLLPGAEWRR